MRTKQWYDKQVDRGRQVIQAGLDRGRVRYVDILEAVQVFACGECPTEGTARTIAGLLGPMTAENLEQLIDEARANMERHAKGMAQHGAFLVRRGAGREAQDVPRRDLAGIKLEDIRTVCRHQASEIVLHAVVFQALLWAVETPEGPSVVY